MSRVFPHSIFRSQSSRFSVKLQPKPQVTAKSSAPIGGGIKYTGWWWEIFTSNKTNSERIAEKQFEDDAVQFKKNCADLKAFGAKYYQAPRGFIDSVGYMPEIKGTLLADGKASCLSQLIKDRPSLVLFKLKDNGEKTLKMYREPFLKEFKDEINSDKVKCVDVVVTEKNIHKIWSFFAARVLKSQMPTELHSSTLLHYGPTTKERMKLGIINALVGWVYLVDNQGRVKWVSHAEPTATEVETMINLTRQLIK